MKWIGFKMNYSEWQGLLGGLSTRACLWVIRSVDVEAAEEEDLFISMPKKDINEFMAHMMSSARYRLSLHSYDWVEFIPSDDDGPDPDDGEEVPIEGLRLVS